MSEKNYISKHIFLFPFKWAYTGSNSKDKYIEISEKLDIEKIAKEIEKLNQWGNYSFEGYDSYNLKKYYYNNVGDVIFSDKKNTVLNYIYKYRNGKYCITIKNNESEKSYYELEIKNIRLNIYKTGIGVLIFNLENYNESKDLFEEMKDVFKINNYGRRVYPQFLPIDEAKNKILPEEVSINFCKIHEEITEKFEYGYEKDNYLSNIITKTLGDVFYFNNESSAGKIKIEPIIDDRMYVICHYKNNYFSKKLSDKNIKNEYKYLEDVDWNSFMFIDNFNDCTIQDKDMILNSNKKHTYNRWTDYGTFYGLTRYSTLVLTEKNEDFFVNKLLPSHIENLYLNMVLLVLVQRSTILYFYDLITDMTNNFIISNKNFEKEYEKLNIEFIDFKNRMYFNEVTPQEQGIEMYRKMREVMEIEKNFEILDEKIKGLYEFSNAVKTRKKNNILFYLTLAASILTLEGVLGIKTEPTKNLLIGYLIFLGIGISIYIASMFIKNKNIQIFFKKLKLEKIIKPIILITVYVIYFIIKLLFNK
jgi:hypothetical protein